MPVSFDTLQIGQKYERPYLTELWGYKGIQAISRGVITPSNTKYIILFVTKEKQKELTQYHDYIDENILNWEGEEKHRSDQRIVQAQNNNDAIHLFYRDIHHTPFVYFGTITLDEYSINIDKPSQFVFLVHSKRHAVDPLDDIEFHQNEFKTLDKTEQQSIIKSRVGQGLFRKRLIQVWGGCSVTGLSNFSLLRASHIKPWRNCTNKERLDPDNGLLLHPVIDHLFDSGLITFDASGIIKISALLNNSELKILNISQNLTLRKKSDRMQKYLHYNRENIFRNS